MKLPRERAAALKNRSMPSSVVIPVLAYPDVRAAVDWLCGAFGFFERLRIGDHRAQLLFGEGCIVVVGRPADPEASESSSSRPLLSHSVMLRVTDVDSHYEHAKRFGVRVAGPPTDYPYGERQYSAEDFGGHHWTFSQTIADVDPMAWGGILFE